MSAKQVADLMVPLDEYPVAPLGVTLLDAIKALNEAQRQAPRGRSPYRAVLVVDENRKVVGKVGQLAFLQALEPKYSVLGDLEKLNVAGLSPEFIAATMQHYRLFEDSLSDVCLRGRALKVDEVMTPIAESVAEDESLLAAIHKIVMWQRQSLLVTRDDVPVGLLRLTDLCDEVARQMKELED